MRSPFPAGMPIRGCATTHSPLLALFVVAVAISITVSIAIAIAIAVTVAVVEVHDQSCAVAHTVFPIELGKGLFDGNLSHAHMLSDFPVGESLTEQGNDKSLPGVCFS